MNQWKESNANLSGEVDGEYLPIQCSCGAGKQPWSFVISIYKDDPIICEKCFKKYYFSNKITIYEKD